jgi:sterol desaturase/sphingolipid hydroxylase (fatty acid hydroxylase superfamily)
MLLPILLTGAFLITESKHVEMNGLASSSALFGIVEGFLRSGEWSAYVLLPYICANLGFWSTSIGSYIYTVSCGTPANLIQYGNLLTRQSRMKKQSSKISLKVQLSEAIIVTFGLLGLNALIGKYFFQYPVVSPDNMWPDAKTFLMQFTAIFVSFDFFAYWQHRYAHVFDIGWHSHKKHHEVQTPIAMNAFITGFWDELQVAACVYLSAFIVQPHPLSYAFAVAGIFSEVASVHSGIDSAWFNFITLRFLPGRADIRLHDSHHMYSNNKGGRNFGHLFWVWDHAFGTLAIYSNDYKVVHK